MLLPFLIRSFSAELESIKQGMVVLYLVWALKLELQMVHHQGHRLEIFLDVLEEGTM